MGVKLEIERTSAPAPQALMERPSEDGIRHYALELFDDYERCKAWLATEHPAFGAVTPERLLKSGDPEDLRRVLTVLVRIDFGVIS